jgi:hypothetical protein
LPQFSNVSKKQEISKNSHGFPIYFENPLKTLFSRKSWIENWQLIPKDFHHYFVFEKFEKNSWKSCFLRFFGNLLKFHGFPVIFRKILVSGYFSKKSWVSGYFSKKSWFPVIFRKNLGFPVIFRKNLGFPVIFEKILVSGYFSKNLGFPVIFWQFFKRFPIFRKFQIPSKKWQLIP